jgi:hypothetical protein
LCFVLGGLHNRAGPGHGCACRWMGDFFTRDKKASKPFIVKGVASSDNNCNKYVYVGHAAQGQTLFYAHLELESGFHKIDQPA